MRFANVDRLLLLASFAIVAHHVSGELVLFGIGLPVFLIAVFAFGTRRDEPNPFPAFARMRVRRLGVPWLFWSAVFGALAVATDDPALAPQLGPQLAYVGGAPHLWFLPFALVASLATWPLHAALCGRDRRRVLWGALLAAVVAALIARRAVTELDRHPELAFPYDAWLFALPAPALGVAFGRLLGMDPARRRAAALRIAGVGLAAGAALWLAKGPDLRARWLLATGAFALAVAWHGRPDPLSRALTPVRYGVYCAHFALVLWLPWPRPWFVRSLAVYAVTAAGIAVLRRTPLGRIS